MRNGNPFLAPEGTWEFSKGEIAKIKKIILEAFLGFVLWTTFLTPYMIFIVKTSLEQYVAWFAMQGIIVPIIAPIVYKITSRAEKKLKVE